jgi:hypothetical protein
VWRQRSGHGRWQKACEATCGCVIAPPPETNGQKANDPEANGQKSKPKAEAAMRILFMSRSNNSGQTKGPQPQANDKRQK